jgi:hypothetical protein
MIRILTPYARLRDRRISSSAVWSQKYFSNSEKIGKIWKKSKMNSEKIWKIWKKGKLNSEKIWKIWKKLKLNSDKIWSSIFFVSFHFATYFSSIFSIFHYSTYFSSIFFISFHNFLLYFPNFITIQLEFPFIFPELAKQN